jgi:hypothetical protein
VIPGVKPGARFRTGRKVFENLGQWVLDALEAFGYAGLVLLLLIENLFSPIPSEVVERYMTRDHEFSAVRKLSDAFVRQQQVLLRIGAGCAIRLSIGQREP